MCVTVCLQSTHWIWYSQGTWIMHTYYICCNIYVRIHETWGLAPGSERGGACMSLCRSGKCEAYYGNARNALNILKQTICGLMVPLQLSHSAKTFIRKSLAHIAVAWVAHCLVCCICSFLKGWSKKSSIFCSFSFHWQEHSRKKLVLVGVKNAQDLEEFQKNKCWYYRDPTGTVQAALFGCAGVG